MLKDMVSSFEAQEKELAEMAAAIELRSEALRQNFTRVIQWCSITDGARGLGRRGALDRFLTG